ncbi:segregation and condensation protein B [Amycolatopsis bartoniae]|uniref:SMC-Scp complex subunit ScpB n=1 Tax=Amycolatopsis bartoniae TaxID=941986 RepID=UPI00181018D6|nr:SMC-Scp complex subunit ScpB [Amycolatopsis bartoniae]MBB2936397.1 segregation and condensation protein B [Amycolatopsis bartoniae]
MAEPGEGAVASEVAEAGPADEPADAAESEDTATAAADTAEAEAADAADSADVAEGAEAADTAATATVDAADATATVDAAADATDSAQAADAADEEDTSFALDRSLPDVSEESTLVSALEALLLVVDSPASEESLAEALDQSVSRVTQTLRSMSERLTERGSGIDLRRVGEGWRFFTRDTYAPFVEKLLLDGQRSKLTRAALETLAVIAYRQPVTRSRVAAVRGVNVDGVIRTLVARGLIEEAGTDPETGGTLYITTELFLERLGLPSLNDLPPIAPLLPEVDAIDDI